MISKVAEEFGGADLGGVIVDDDAEVELASVMEKTRRLRQVVVKKEDDDVAQKVYLSVIRRVIVSTFIF